MSQVLMQEAKAISAKLSATEKTILIEWLSSQLRQELEDNRPQPAGSEQNGTYTPTNGHRYPHQQDQNTGGADDDPATPWTLEEVQAMMKPEPKSGAEIAAMIESGEIDTSVGAEMEIPDVVAWLQDLRRQERLDRRLEE